MAQHFYHRRVEEVIAKFHPVAPHVSDGIFTLSLPLTNIFYCHCCYRRVLTGSFSSCDLRGVFPSYWTAGERLPTGERPSTGVPRREVLLKSSSYWRVVAPRESSLLDCRTPRRSTGGIVLLENDRLLESSSYNWRLSVRLPRHSVHITTTRHSTDLFLEKPSESTTGAAVGQRIFLRTCFSLKGRWCALCNVNDTQGWTLTRGCTGLDLPLQVDF